MNAKRAAAAAAAVKISRVFSTSLSLPHIFVRVCMCDRLWEASGKLFRGKWKCAADGKWFCNIEKKSDGYRYEVNSGAFSGCAIFPRINARARPALNL